MRFVSLSDIGLHRKINQDSYISVYNKDHDLLFLVCDGIGGAKAGEVASLEIVKYFGEIFAQSEGFKDKEAAINYIKYHVRNASNHVYQMSVDNPDYEGMGTTIAGLLISSVGDIVFNAGDSRVYYFLDHKLRQITSDHTLVNELLQRKMITKEEAKIHPKRHYLTKFLGVYEDASCEIYLLSDHPDYYLLSTDGLHGYVLNKEIEAIIDDENLSLEEKAQCMIKKALDKGGYDNITLTLVKIGGDKDE